MLDTFQSSHVHKMRGLQVAAQLLHPSVPVAAFGEHYLTPDYLMLLIWSTKLQIRVARSKATSPLLISKCGVPQYLPYLLFFSSSF